MLHPFRAPSGAAARAPSPSSSPLPPQRYRALRARYNALLVTLYERFEPDAARDRGGRGPHRTRHADQGARARLPAARRHQVPGRHHPRRAPRGPAAAAANAKATERVLAAFADVARELAASADAQAASEVKSATHAPAPHRARPATRDGQRGAAAWSSREDDGACVGGEGGARGAGKARTPGRESLTPRRSGSRRRRRGLPISASWGNEQTRIRLGPRGGRGPRRPPSRRQRPRRISSGASTRLRARIRPRPRPGPRVRCLVIRCRHGRA